MPADLLAGRLTRRASKPALGFSLLGLGISIYLTIEHFSAARLLACPESAAINCAKVTTSHWSHILGIPVAVLGLAFFLVITVLLLPPAWREPRLDAARVVACVVGTAMVLYLVYIELFRVNAICLWCTAVHVCTVAVLGAVLWHTSVVGTEQHLGDLDDR